MRASPAGSVRLPTRRSTLLIWWADVDHRVVLSSGLAASAALPPAARDLGVERVELRRPERAEGVEPGVDVAERPGVDGVEAARALGPHRREPGLAQDAEVLGDRGLGDAEFGPDDLRDRPGRALALGQQLEDAPADRVAEDVERVHDDQDITMYLYKY